MILVTGNPRSGTLSVKNMLRAADYDVLHERNGKDGTVSCFFFMQAYYYPREKLTVKRHRTDEGSDENFSDYFRRYKTIIHLVRNPLHCIPSMAKIVGTGHQEWLEYHCVVSRFRPKIEWAAEAWYYTNCAIEREMMMRRHHDIRVIQIERILQDWPKELRRPPNILHQHAGSGTRKSRPLTVKQLHKITPMSGYILEQARSYGYKI